MDTFWINCSFNYNRSLKVVSSTWLSNVKQPAKCQILAIQLNSSIGQIIATLKLGLANQGHGAVNANSNTI